MVNSFEDVLREVQHCLTEQSIDGWLLVDDHGRNSLACTFLRIPQGKMCTRRFFYWIPQKGDPVKIIPKIEPYTLDHLPGKKLIYRSWMEMESTLKTILKDKSTIAMEYSPRNALPSVSKVDAGMVDLIREFGCEVTSSANLLQKHTSIWTPQQLLSHRQAAQVLSDIVDKTWQYIGNALKESRSINEYTIQQFMLDLMAKNCCITADPPICAVNAHSADPHYCPERSSAVPIQSGDFILLDLWCKLDQPHAVYADIARVGVARSSPTERQNAIFDIVKHARDKATRFIEARLIEGKGIKGWEVDQVCRDIIVAAGYGDFFIHRTGHNIGEDVHGSGTNLDNFETHDVRDIIPGTCFSIEPGIYLPGEFGVRLEYDVYVHNTGRIEITGGVQEFIVCIN